MSFIDNVKPTLIISKDIVGKVGDVDKITYSFGDNNELTEGKNILYSKKDYDAVVNKMRKTMIMLVESQLKFDEVSQQLANCEVNVEFLQKSNISNMENVLAKKYLLECRVKELEEELNKFNKVQQTPIDGNQSSVDKVAGYNNGVEQLAVNLNGCLTDPTLVNGNGSLNLQSTE